jgi:hypothetical protein
MLFVHPFYWTLTGTAVAAFAYAFFAWTRRVQKEQGIAQKESADRQAQAEQLLHAKLGLIMESAEESRHALKDLAERTQNIEERLQRSLSRCETQRVKPKPTSPFTLPFEKALEIGPFLTRIGQYMLDLSVYRLASIAPPDTTSMLSRDPTDDKYRYSIVRNEDNALDHARFWVNEVDKEKGDLLELRHEAKVFLATLDRFGNLDQVTASDCFDLASECCHVLTTAGLTVVHVLSNLSLHNKIGAISSKVNRIHLQLNAEQIGKIRGPYDIARELFEGEVLDVTRIVLLRHELSAAQGGLLAELTSVIATVPLAGSYWTTKGYENEYGKHFNGSPAKALLAMVAFLSDLALVQETDMKDVFLQSTVPMRAKEVGLIADTLNQQVQGKDPTRIASALTLCQILQGFRWLLNCLAGQPAEAAA